MQVTVCVLTQLFNVCYPATINRITTRYLFYHCLCVNNVYSNVNLSIFIVALADYTYVLIKHNTGHHMSSYCTALLY